MGCDVFHTILQRVKIINSKKSMFGGLHNCWLFMGIILAYCMLFCAIYKAPFRLQYDMNNSSKQDTHNSDLLLHHGAKKRENEKSHSHYSLCYSLCIPITTAVGNADAAAQINTTRYLELPKIKGGG